MKFEWYVAHQVPFADPQSFIGFAAKAGLCDNQDFWACTFTPNPLHDLQHSVFKLGSGNWWRFKGYKVSLRELLEQS